jgi:Family of unknown function (DUF6763)
VVGIDDDARTIDIQSFDGDLDEIDRDSWDVIAPARTDQPEDWAGAPDDVERDDLVDADAGAEPRNLLQSPAPLGIDGWDDNTERRYRC